MADVFEALAHDGQVWVSIRPNLDRCRSNSANFDAAGLDQIQPISDSGQFGQIAPRSANCVWSSARCVVLDQAWVVIIRPVLAVSAGLLQQRICRALRALFLRYCMPLGSWSNFEVASAQLRTTGAPDFGSPLGDPLGSTSPGCQAELAPPKSFPSLAAGGPGT